MKQLILEKTYEVSPETKKVLDCKILNDGLYSAIYDIAMDLEPSNAEQFMNDEVFKLYSRIDDILTKYLGLSVGLNLGELKNTEGKTVRI